MSFYFFGVGDNDLFASFGKKNRVLNFEQCFLHYLLVMNDIDAVCFTYVSYHSLVGWLGTCTTNM
jgi:hypothetical protein